ncbi:dihydroxyacetone kinase subunit DhaL [Ciceribacter azotifigens]|uniref:dihydroxyacetone kinase subunit DhaL n=1 Tax=Ciceribacter azotifigens TaxID=2069303 RepID=UPI003A858627
MVTSASRLLGRMFQLISAAMQAEKDHLSDLDGAIGDADHGITMALGFAAVTSAINKLEIDRMPPSDVLLTAANAFLDAVGASTGPLYASAFRKAADALKHDEHLSQKGQVAMLEAIAQGIRDRGKGQRGDKTMLDAWIPAAEAAVGAHEKAMSVADMWQAIVLAAETGAASTRSMVATKGRAARLGERSLGHTDPGAASAVAILHAMRETFAGKL